MSVAAVSVSGQGAADRRSHPAVDRLGRPSGQLLEDDRADERAERPVGIAWPMRDRSDLGDEIRQHRIPSGDLVDCGAEG